MRDKNSLYLAAGDSGAGLIEEHRCAARAGLPGDFLDHAHAARHFRHRARRRDRFVRRGRCRSDATGAWAARGWRLRAARGCSRRGGGVRCRRALGQCPARQRPRDRGAHRSCSPPATSCPTSFTPPCTTVSSSWAIATAPQPQNIWNDGALIWEDAKDYLYARTTRAGRIIIGGEDSDDDRRAGGARPPDPGKVARAGAEARGALAAREHRDRIPLGRHVRHHAATDCR